MRSASHPAPGPPALAVPVIEESVHVEKVGVERGGYRLTKKVGSSGQFVDELLDTHHAEIERRAVGRDLADEETVEARYEGDTFVVPVVEEILVVTKKLRLVEEIRIRSRRSTRRETQWVTLRQEEVEIERLDTAAGSPFPSNARSGMQESS